MKQLAYLLLLVVLVAVGLVITGIVNLLVAL